jgi:hypothetical protein
VGMHDDVAEELEELAQRLAVRRTRQHEML